MAGDTDTHAAVRPPETSAPTAATALRAEMTRTRLRLATSIGDAQDMVAPSRLIPTGAQVVRHAAGRHLAGLAEGVVNGSRMPAPPRFGSVIALIVAAVVTKVVARRRTRRSGTSLNALAPIALNLLRSGSPWFAVALSVFAALSRRRHG